MSIEKEAADSINGKTPNPAAQAGDARHMSKGSNEWQAACDSPVGRMLISGMPPETLYAMRAAFIAGFNLGETSVRMAVSDSISR